MRWRHEGTNQGREQMDGERFWKGINWREPGMGQPSLP